LIPAKSQKLTEMCTSSSNNVIYERKEKKRFEECQPCFESLNTVISKLNAIQKKENFKIRIKL